MEITCNKCQLPKLPDMFEGRSKVCRGCRKVYFKELNAKRKEYIKTNGHTRQQENRRKIWEYLNVHPCIECGESDPIMLDFDHIKGDKKCCVSRMAGKSYKWETIEQEIDKCVVRCVKCHRRKTALEQGWYSFMQASGV